MGAGKASPGNSPCNPPSDHPFPLRLFTNGWDIYTPNLNLVAHHYYRKEKHKFWEVNPQWYGEWHRR